MVGIWFSCRRKEFSCNFYDINGRGKISNFEHGNRSCNCKNGGKELDKMYLKDESSQAYEVYDTFKKYIHIAFRYEYI